MLAKLIVVADIVSSQKSMLDALHKETDSDTRRYRIQTVFIAIPVVFQYKSGVKNPHIADSADRFVFRSIDIDRETGHLVPWYKTKFSTLLAQARLQP